MWRATLGASLQELRFIVGTAESSNGLREFIKTTYVPLKAMNPTFPLLVREGSAVHPTIVARRSCGKEVTANVSNMSVAQIESQVEKMATSL